MAQNTTYRSNPSSQHYSPSMDPIEKNKYQIYHPSTTTTPRHHQPTTPSDSSIHSISNNFSKLYTNHKLLSSLKPTHKNIHQHPHPEAPIHTTFSSSTTLTKSKSQHGTMSIVPVKQDTKTKVVKERFLVKPPKFELIEDIHSHFVKPKGANSEQEMTRMTQKEWKTKELIEEKNVKKGQSLMLRSYSGGLGDVRSRALMSRRKSCCSSQIEVADFFLCSGVKLVAVDMPPFMQVHAVDCARKAYDSLEKFTARTLASTLKREFDGVYGPAWHCIVGTSFGSFVTHSVGGFMYFSMDQKLYILLFKTTVQKAE